MVTQTKHKVVDVSAGCLVWVRRRNGSWWPGRVMGLDELPERCSRSPRLGTPVKLLGRKDLNVDWYNFEKSSYVKAFRCRDFDGCIEKAKASASRCTKTSFKYGCRDDAILHALKIENVQGSDCSHQFCSREDIIGNINVESCSRSNFTQSAISLETMNTVNVSKEDGFMKKKRRKTPNDSEDDGTEGTKRMRDLDDIGLRMVPVQNSGEHSEAVFSDSNSLGGSDICDNLSGCSPVNSSKGFLVYLRRRHSNIGHHVNDSLKRKSDRQTISKVLEGTSTVDCSSVGDGDITDVKVSGIKSLESVKTNIISNNSDSTGTSYQKKIASSNYYEDSDARGHKYCASNLYQDCTKGGIERDTSKVQLRWKRNSALLGKDINMEERTIKSKVYLMNGNDSFHGSIMSEGWGQVSNGSVNWKKRTAGRHPISGNEDSLHSAGILSSQHSHCMHYSPDTGYLFDVHLEVQATYKGNYVPLVSITSKLNGNSIVGHPVTVAILEDGFCDNLITSMDLFHGTSGSELSGLLKAKSLIDVRVRKWNLPQKMMESEVRNASSLAVGLGRLPTLRKCGGLPKKTRKLSSIAAGHEYREDERRVAMMDGAYSVDTACVPLKVVFTRINEALR
ncbi:hypothetical protein H6P81_000078 [Aristolochia fimbriata]|uniref:PWWP domain-containing protein n=1 Tax=Aristolochia fimbriata TaxID=158543 RepID=A0AAV7F338_ARIFI|nr:hypothetical protein H6P81_000078 [Aristolochia fimbriata]